MRTLTPFALVTAAVFATDIVFAVDSVPAVYGITGDPYLVFVTNAFALLGLRALYFVLEGALSALVHLSYGLAAILGFIGFKLALHWAHLRVAVGPRGADPRLALRDRRHPGRHGHHEPRRQPPAAGARAGVRGLASSRPGLSTRATRRRAWSRRGRSSSCRRWR